MRIVIIGAGIGGLSTYLFLRKHLQASDHEIVVYDAYDIHKLSIHSKPLVDPTNPTEPIFTPAAIGNAIGISKNGLAALSRLSKNGRLLDEMQSKGHPIKYWQQMTARGWNLSKSNMTTLKEKGNSYEALMIARQTAWEVLRDEVLKEDDNAVITKKIKAVQIPEAGQGRPIIEFADSTQDEADLLVGADGLRSCVRKAMFKDTTDTEPRTWLDCLLRKPSKIKDYITPHYGGLSGVGGFIPSFVLEENNHPSGTMNIIFGPNGFFGCGYITPNKLSELSSISSTTSRPGEVATWWATFSSSTDNPFPTSSTKNQKPSNVETTTTTTTKSTFDKDAALTDILHRFQHWKPQIIHSVLDYVKIHGIEAFYPTHTTPELPKWTQSGTVVLVGDAAHALQPSSGQGFSQAVEDAESLAVLLSHYLDTSKTGDVDGCARALKKYERLRMPRVRFVYEQSQKMSRMKADMGFFMEMVMYFQIWVSGLVGVWERFNSVVMDYDLPLEVKRIIEEDDT